MKKIYIQPETENVRLNSNNDILQDPALYGNGVSGNRVATTMDGNSTTFDENEDWLPKEQSSLWDE